MMGNETDDIIKELFYSLLDNYLKENQMMIGGSGFNFESVNLLDYHLHKVSLKKANHI